MSTPRLFRSAGIISLGTLASRILGLVREIMMARVFGTSVVASGFFVAFTIPNLFRRLFGEGALSAAFIPAYVRSRDQEGPEAGWRLFRNLLSLVLILLGGISLAGMAAATLILEYARPAGRVVDILLPLRIMLPYMVWICMAALVMGVLNSHRRYTVSALTPCLLNVVWILALIGVQRHPGMAPEIKVLWISWSILIAGVLQFGVQLPVLRKLHYRAPSEVHPLGPGVRRVMIKMGPAALGAAVTQLNVLLDRFLAMWAGPYGPAALSFAERLIYLPLGLFATALGTILLPEMSALAHRKETESLGGTVEQSLRGLLYLMVPAAVGLGILATPIVTMVYARGEFDADSVTHTARALMFYAPGLVVFSLAKVFVPVFYAHQDTRTPVKVGLVTVSGNIVLSILFVILLPEGWKHAGLALGTVIAELAQVVLLARLMHRRYVRPRWGRVLLAGGKHLLAALPMIATAQGVLTQLPNLPLLLSLPLAIGAAGLVYLAATLLLRCREPGEFRHR